MKTTILIILSLFACCLLSVPGARSQTAYYGSSNENPETGIGVVGVEYLGTGYGTAGFFESMSEKGTGVGGKGGMYGGVFSSWAVDGAGVLGMANSKEGATWGGYFVTFSEGGSGVYGHANSETGKTYGGNFISDSSDGTALRAEATSLAGYTYGGYFTNDSSNGIALKAEAKSKVGKTYGGHFYAEAGSATAVYGHAAGGYGKGGHFISDGSNGIGVKGEAKGLELNYGVYGLTRSANGYGVYSQGNMKCTGNQIVGKNLLVKGNQTVTGTKSAVVKLKNGEGVALYAVEASENWFEDFGSAKLTDGAAVVAIDPLYSETVNTEIDYHVFLTPRGECKGLYVVNQKSGSFEVRELNGGKSDIPFSYRIVAKRKGYEDVRLAKVKEETLTAMTTVEEDVKKGEAIGGRRKVK